MRVPPNGLCAGVLLAGVVSVITAPAAQAWEINPANTIPNTVANSLIANGDGGDWNSAVLLIELTEGSIYSAPEFDDLQPQFNLWNFVPELQFDSWVGIPGDSTNSILGGAGDFGDFGPAVIADQKASVTWFNTDTTNTGPTRIANITLTNDAMGTYSLIAGFSIDLLISQSGFVVNGVLQIEPPTVQGDLNGDGFVGIDDLNIILGEWNQSVPPSNPQADPSGDGFVGIDDLNTVLGNWNAGVAPTPASVPEPASAALLLIGATALLQGRRSA